MSRDDPENSQVLVWLDGEDVSETCIRFDDVAGWVLLTDKTKQYGKVTYKSLVQRPLSVDRRVGDAYGSHIPILIGLAKIFEIEKVIEFGCGLYSTPTFLNCGAFPELYSLLSIDDNQKWIDKLGITDERVQFSLSVDDLDFSDIDLVFVDDSVARRLSSIKLVSNLQNCILVFHDLEDRTYGRATRNIQGLFTFRIFNPFTGARCDANLEMLNNFILMHNYIAPTDTVGWIEAFEGFENYQIIECEECGI